MQLCTRCGEEEGACVCTIPVPPLEHLDDERLEEASEESGERPAIVGPFAFYAEPLDWTLRGPAEVTLFPSMKPPR